MNIHFILGSGVYPYVFGGMEIFNFFLIKNLPSEIKISYSSYKKIDDLNFTFCKLFKLKPEKILVPFQLLIHQLFFKKKTIFVFSFSEASWVVWFLYTIVMKLFKRKYVIIVHHGKKPNWKFQFPYNYFFKNAKKIFVVSEDIKKNYDSLFKTGTIHLPPLVPFTVSPINIDEIKNEYQIPINSFIFLSVGSLKKMKNPDIILRAFCNISQNFVDDYNAFLIFAGDGEMKIELENCAINSNYSKRIIFLGNVDKLSINKLYKISDSFIMASDYEGTSVAILEAMFNKIPIIASNVRGVNNLLQNLYSAQLFELNNIRELSNFMTNNFCESEKYKEFANNAFNEYNNRFNYQDMITNYLDHLNSI